LGYLSETDLLKIDHPCLVKILATQIKACDEPKIAAVMLLKIRDGG
jgi:hypothetical protein